MKTSATITMWWCLVAAIMAAVEAFPNAPTSGGGGNGSGSGSGLCSDGDLRGEQLTPGLTLISQDGNLLMNTSLLLTACVGGDFGGACHRGFDDVDAALACSSLGYDYGGEVASYQGNNYNGPIYIQDISCSGRETHPSQCNVSTDITPDCASSDSIVRINCYSITDNTGSGSGGRGLPTSTPTPACSTGDLTLEIVSQVSQNTVIGLPLTCTNGTYGSICSSGFDDLDALVVCRNFLGQVGVNVTGATAQYGAFGSYTGPVALQDINCMGNEASLLECPASTNIDSFCMDPSTAVGVQCSAEVPRCVDGDISLLSFGITELSGDLLFTFEATPVICVNGTFGPICNDNVNQLDVSRAACLDIANQLGYFDPSFDSSAIFRNMSNTVPIVAQDISCPGDVMSLGNCSYSTMIDSPCNMPSLAAAFQCTISATPGGMGDMQDLLAPFGTEFGDVVLNRGQYENSPEIFLSPAFPYFGQNMASLFINSNGFISFLLPCESSVCFNSRDFPFVSPPLIATLWSDYELNSGDMGDVYYRTTRDSVFLSNISEYIQTQRSVAFRPSYAVVVTWFELTERLSSQASTNTFQVILATDGHTSYVGFSYGRLEVPRLTYAGFNFGDENSFMSINTVRIEDGTNVPNDATSGRYLYRVNDLPQAVCQNGNIRETQLNDMTVGDELIITSLIEVCVNGIYGAVCDRNIGATTVLFACNSLGYGVATGGVLAIVPYSYNGRIILESISCTGNESSAEFCNLDVNVSPACANAARAAKIRCFYPNPNGNASGNGSGIRQDFFLPFGEAVNDTVIPNGCNLYSRPISLSPPFAYFGRNLSTVYINSDGYFSFEEIFTSCCNDYFPTISPPLIAALWRGYNTSRFGAEGSVTYRLARDPETLSMISNFISGRYFTFEPSYVVVATWNMVPTDNSEDFSRYSFQAVLTSNGMNSFVLFSYGNLDGISEVQVGFNLGDGYNYGPNPNDNPLLANRYLFSSFVDIHNNSNTGVNGLYSYRVDDVTSIRSSTAVPPTNISPTVFSDNFCFDGEYRLLTINSTTTTTRNLETLSRDFYVPVFCVNGTFGYICDREWDINDATMICRGGRGSSFTVVQPVYGVMVNSSLPPISYSIQDVNCSMNDYALQDCSFRLADNAVCGAGNSSSIAGAICEQLPTPCQEGEFRVRDQMNFYNGYTTIRGRVEVCQNGSYAAVCSGGLNQEDAQSICRYVGVSPYHTASIFEVEGWPGDVIPGAECNGTIGPICQISSSDICVDPTRVAGIICTEVLSQCFSTGDIRYTNADTITNSSGIFSTARVEVCFNGTYGSICDKYITDEGAESTCRERFSASMGQVISSPNLESSPPIVLQSTSDCQSAFYCGEANFTITDPDCQGSSRAVGISCFRVCYDGDTRIVGGNSFYEGVVEICRNGEWGVICDQGWNDISAAVLCQERGFGAGGSVATFGWSSQRPVVTSNVTCNLRYNDALSTCLNCTTIPNGCSSQTAAGVRCQPGSLLLNIVPNGIAEYNSPFSLRCNGRQTPFNSSLDSYRWMDSDGLIMDDARRSSRVVPSGLEGYYYRQFFFNTSLDIQNLRVEDAGIYYCSMSINITYPDGPNNSSSIVTNTTYFALWIRVPPPSVTFAARPPPYFVNEPLVTTCLVNTVEGLSVPDVNIGWFDMYGQPITTNSRVTVGEVVATNATWFSRTITVLRLIGSDSGNYTCRSSITGSFYYSDESRAIEPLVVEGLIPLIFGSGVGAIPIVDRIADFGLQSGDSILPDGDYLISPAITLNPPLPFFGEPQTELYVHTDGFMTFQRMCESCLPSPFPIGNIPPTIAVLWQNFANTETQGDVFYRVTSDAQEMHLIYSFILQESGEEFVPTYAVIVTWHNLPEWTAGSPPGNSTFQAVITTDGTRSYIFLFYSEVDLFRPAEVGFNYGDGGSFLSVASLQDASSFGIQSRSNLVNVVASGLYIFRIDDLPVSSSTEATSQVPSSSTREGSDEEPSLQMNGAVSTVSMPSIWLLSLLICTLIYVSY